MTQKQFREVAENLARYNAEADETIREVYWFPDSEERELRILEVDESAPPSGQCALAYYFAPDVSEGIPYPSGVALIRPEEVREIEPPEGWDGWDKAEKIWPVEEAPL